MQKFQTLLRYRNATNNLELHSPSMKLRFFNLLNVETVQWADSIGWQQWPRRSAPPASARTPPQSPPPNEIYVDMNYFNLILIN